MQRWVEIVPSAAKHIQLGRPVAAEPKRKYRIIQEENGMRDARGYRDGKPVGSRPFNTDASAESRGSATNVAKRKENPTEWQCIELVIVYVNVDAPHHSGKRPAGIPLNGLESTRPFLTEDFEQTSAVVCIGDDGYGRASLNRYIRRADGARLALHFHHPWTRLRPKSHILQMYHILDARFCQTSENPAGCGYSSRMARHPAVQVVFVWNLGRWSSGYFAVSLTFRQRHFRDR